MAHATAPDPMTARKGAALSGVADVRATSR